MTGLAFTHHATYLGVEERYLNLLFVLVIPT